MISSRSQAGLTARQRLAEKPLFLDTETTGIERNSQIVEICILDDDGEIVFESLVRPTSSIPADVVRIHHITNEMVARAPGWHHVWPQVQAVLAGRLVGIYNAEFDLRMFQQTHASYNLRWPLNPGFTSFCIMKLYAQFYGDWNPSRGSYRWHSLEAAGRQSRVPLPNSHRAQDDASLARAILHYIAESQ